MATKMVARVLAILFRSRDTDKNKNSWQEESVADIVSGAMRHLIDRNSFFFFINIHFPRIGGETSKSLQKLFDIAWFLNQIFNNTPLH